MYTEHLPGDQDDPRTRHLCKPFHRGGCDLVRRLRNTHDRRQAQLVSLRYEKDFQQDLDQEQDSHHLDDRWCSSYLLAHVSLTPALVYQSRGLFL